MRQAYRDLARRLHPDRQTGATDAERSLAERRIREINQAWKVLGDRAARARYDEALARASRVGSGEGPGRPAPPASRAVRPSVDQDDDDLIDVGPDLGPLGSVVMRSLPWVAVLGALILIFVVTAYATGGRGQPSPTTIQTARVGSCVRVVEPGPVAVGVDCGATGALRVVKRVDPLQGCPPGSELRRFQPDPVADCLAKTG